MNKPTLYIPDASLILAYLLNEQPWRKQIGDFFSDWQAGKNQCAVPSLWYYEVANRLSRIKKQKISNLSDVMFADDHNFGFTLIDTTKEQCEIALELCRKYPGITFYDAAYHALAIFTQGIFLTADQQYYRQTKAESNIDFISNY